MTLLHGIEFDVASARTAAVPISNTVAGVIGDGTGTAGDGDLSAYDTPQLVTTVTEATTLFGAGTIVNTVENLLALSNTQIVCVRWNEDTGTIDEFKSATAAMETAEEVTQYRPRLIAAPGVARNSANNGGVNTFATELQRLAEAMMAYCITDTDNASLAAAVAYGTNNGASRLRLIYQQINNPVASPVDGSSYILGAMIRNDASYGIQDDISNRELAYITSVTPNISFNYISSVTQAGQLDAVHITSIVRPRGVWRAWGNTTKTGSPDDIRRFIGYSRVVDKVQESIVEGSQLLIDRGITYDFPQRVCRISDNIFSTMKEEGELISGRCNADDERNTADSIAAGNLYVNLIINGIPVARRLRYRMTPLL